MKKIAVFCTALFLATSCGSSPNSPPDGSIEVIVFPHTGPSTDALSAYNSCLGLAPCGGNLLGTWGFQGGCATFPDLATCDRFMDVQMSGTITFRADGTYVVNVPTYSVVYKMSDSCVVAQGRSCTGNICQQGSQGYCDCLFYSNLSEVSAGTYSVNGTALSLVPDVASASTGSFLFDMESTGYCVQGEMLVLVSQAKPNSNGVSQAIITTVRPH